MSRPTAPVVAELGRPETPDETADRKAAASAAYRSSQTFRSLIAALLVTMAVVIVIVLIVPRGEPAPQPRLDLPPLAANAESALGRAVLIPEVPKDWRVNRAELVGGAVTVWDVTIAPTGDEARGFAHIAQALDVNRSWAATPLKGVAPKGIVAINGRDWDVYSLPRPADSGNISYALGSQAGSDYILIYGSLSEKTAASLAQNLAPQLDAIEEVR